MIMVQKWILLIQNYGKYQELPPLTIDPIMHSPTTQSTSPSSASSGDSAEHNSLPLNDLDVPIAVRKPIRQHNLPARYRHDIANYVSYECLSPS